ncbi:hypothetical protein MU516_07250 [Paracoccus sp. YLB-12]|uniref:Uncharacterized protein n=1 Tax=Paracoccus maritimus TaxID=2933292 RepID=A0ABT2K832_9RHOB|nr:hypothetical protein [Paracoccus sp. YLB-12]MCT4332662.1 hypothetical protein [Paracoccus sp. YLB-12]
MEKAAQNRAKGNIAAAVPKNMPETASGRKPNWQHLAAEGARGYLLPPWRSCISTIRR